MPGQDLAGGFSVSDGLLYVPHGWAWLCEGANFGDFDGDRVTDVAAGPPQGGRQLGFTPKTERAGWSDERRLNERVAHGA